MKSVASSQIKERILSGEELLFLLSSEQKQLEALKPMVNAVKELIDGVAATPDNDVAGMLLQTAQFLNRIGDRKGYYRLYALALMAQPGGQKLNLEWINLAEVIVAHTALTEPCFKNSTPTREELSWKEATAHVLKDLPELENLFAEKPGRANNKATPATRLENYRKGFEKTMRHPEHAPIKNKYALQTYSVGLERIAECKGDKVKLECLAKDILLNVKAALQSFHSNPATAP
jgi:hypothetical protein